MKKLIRMGICALVIFSMMVTNAFMLKAEEPTLASSTSTNATPTVVTDSTDKKVHVTETSKWTNVEKTEGEITLDFKTDYEKHGQIGDSIDFIFVADQSGSMSGERTSQLKKALNESADTLLGGSVDNRLSLVTFGTIAQTLTDFTDDSTTFEAAVDNMASLGLTSYSSGLREASRLIKARGDTTRKPIVIFMSDGGAWDNEESIISVVNQLKEKGVELYTIQYLQGSSIKGIMKAVASGADKAYNASALTSLNKVYKEIIGYNVSEKTYKDLELKLDLEDTNFKIKSIQTNSGTATQSGNGLNWTIPIVKSGESSSLTIQFKLKDASLEGNLNIHEVATLKATGVSETTTPVQLILSSSSLGRFISTIFYDGNGSTEGTAPDSQTAKDETVMNIANNPGGLSKKGKVFKGWQREGNKEIVGNTLVMPENDITLEAIWGSADIEMNTNTILKQYEMKNLNNAWNSFKINKNMVSKIAFVDHIDETAGTTWDMSADDKGTIKAWIVGRDLYIGSEGKIMAPSDSTMMFYNFQSLTSLEMDNFDTSKVINMSYMFSGLHNMQLLDLSHFNTSQVTDMSGMFSNCLSLSSLDISNFDTSNVTNMSFMFATCKKLASLDISNFDTSKVTNMLSMFGSCASLTSLDISHFNTSKVTNMGSMFGGCATLTLLDLSSFDTSKVINMGSMFGGCATLTLLDLSSFDLNQVTDLEQMFTNSNALATVYAKDQETANKLNTSSEKPTGFTVIVKPVTASLTSNEEIESLTKEEETVEASKTLSIRPTLLDNPGTSRSNVAKTTVEGGLIAPAKKVDYIIYAKYDATNDNDKSGVMTITNPLPDGMKYIEGSAVSGKVTRQAADGIDQTGGYIYDIRVEGNVLTFKVNRLSAGAQIGLSYEVTSPENPTNSYREFLNNASVTMDSVGETSNYVRHFFGATTETKYDFTYSYDGSIPTNAPDVPLGWKYTKDQVVNIQNVSMPGYIFNGWKYNGASVGNTLQMPDANVTLVGSWTKVEPTQEVKSKVTYQYGGEVPTGASIPKDESYIVGSKIGETEKITGKSVTLANVPTADDYEFLGWASNQLKPDEITNGSFELGKEDIVITGKWKKKEYQVIYKYLDATPAEAPALPSAEMHEWGSEVTPKSKVSDLSTYAFDGWYTNNSIDPDYEDGFTMPKEDVTFYAAWTSTEGTHTIDYIYEGETPSDVSGGTDSCFKDTTGIVWTKPTTTSTKNALGHEGAWTFDGWTSADVSLASDGTFTMPDNDIKIKGTWTFKEGAKKVTFKVVNGTWNDGSAGDKEVVVDFLRGKGTLQTSDVPSGMKASIGYTNGKWLVIPNTTMNGITGAMTYTYAFEKVKYDIGYKEEEGSIGGLIEDIEYGKNIIVKDENGVIQETITVGPDTGEIIIPTIEGKTLVGVEVSKDDDGNVTLKPNYKTIENPEQPEITPEPGKGNIVTENNKENKAPDTSDTTIVHGSLMLFVISGGILCFLKKKKTM